MGWDERGWIGRHRSGVKYGHYIHFFFCFFIF
jgi:hypothetical protein